MLSVLVLLCFSFVFCNVFCCWNEYAASLGTLNPWTVRDNGVKGAMMVVSPLSTLTNWKREFEKWAPSVDVCLYHGRDT